MERVFSLFIYATSDAREWCVTDINTAKKIERGIYIIHVIHIS
jgi:hypothetical protein